MLQSETYNLNYGVLQQNKKYGQWSQLTRREKNKKASLTYAKISDFYPTSNSNTVISVADTANFYHYNIIATCSH